MCVRGALNSGYLGKIHEKTIKVMKFYLYQVLGHISEN